MSGRPDVTVVVATHGRATMLPALFRGLAAQVGSDRDLQPDRIEVVVVDDASPDDTPEVLARLAAAAPFPVRVLRFPTNRGPAAARNAGWRAGGAPVVAFTDDDCVPQAGWLDALLVSIRSGADIAQGRTEPDPDAIDAHGPFGRTMRVPREEGFYETCNIAYGREWLGKVDGFDEGYQRPYGEDTDLAWRARSAGAQTAFVDDAVVHHAVFPSDWRAAFADVARCDGLHRTLRRHPELRRHLGKRVFHRPTHAAALVVAAAAVAATASPRSRVAWAAVAGAGARYAWSVRQHRHAPESRAHWAAVVPAALVLDLYETAAFARASLRYRTLLL
jgi:glycosyltransferase involved in cell wall biosynthesis